MVSASSFGSKDPGFESCCWENSSHACMALHCTAPFIITHHLDMTNIVERDIHQHRDVTIHEIIDESQ